MDHTLAVMAATGVEDPPSPGTTWQPSHASSIGDAASQHMGMVVPIHYGQEMVLLRQPWMK